MTRRATHRCQKLMYADGLTSASTLHTSSICPLLGADQELFALSATPTTFHRVAAQACVSHVCAPGWDHTTIRQSYLQIVSSLADPVGAFPTRSVSPLGATIAVWGWYVRAQQNMETLGWESRRWSPPDFTRVATDQLGGCAPEQVLFNTDGVWLREVSGTFGAAETAVVSCAEPVSLPGAETRPLYSCAPAVEGSQVFAGAGFLAALHGLHPWCREVVMPLPDAVIVASACAYGGVRQPHPDRLTLRVEPSGQLGRAVFALVDGDPARFLDPAFRWVWESAAAAVS